MPARLMLRSNMSIFVRATTIYDFPYTVAFMHPSYKVECAYYWTVAAFTKWTQQIKGEETK